MTSRCPVIVTDRLTHKNRKCLHKRHWGTICSVHARKYIVKIQAAWRCYIVKNKINLFKKLPGDIWALVLQHITNRDNKLKLLESHEKIYIKRIQDIHDVYSNRFSRMSTLEFNTKLKNYSSNRDYFRQLINTY